MASVCSVVCIGKPKIHVWLVSVSHDYCRTSERKGCLHEVVQSDRSFASESSLLFTISMTLTPSKIKATWRCFG